MKDYTRKTKEYYAKHADTYSALIASWRMHLIAQYNAKNKVILDLGCGTGNYLLKLFNNNVFGIDISKKSIDILKKRTEYTKIKNKKTLIVGNALHMPFKNNIFDILFSFSTMYYIKELDEVLIQIHRILKPRGIVILEFGNKYSINSVWDKIMFDVPQFHFSEKRIWSELDRNGFQIKKVYYRQVIPNFWNKFDKDFVKNPLLQKISFRMIFVIEKK